MKSFTLFLMTQKGYEVLEELIKFNFQTYIHCVIISKDSNIENDFYDEIVALCQINNINYKNRTELVEISSEYSIAISWRWLIHVKQSKLIVLHDSLLPKYRGFAPLVNAILNRDNKVGVTALLASNEYDTGDIIFQSAIDVLYPIKIQNLINQISILYKELIIKIFEQIISENQLIVQKQNTLEATYSLWRDEDDYLIDWTLDAESILNFVNAVGYPYLSASTYINKQKIRIIDVEIEEDVFVVNRAPGKVIFIREGKFPVIVCGKGLIKINQAVFDDTKESVLPFKNFRTRLTNQYS
jgi:methionyl-tRNA formyltransferase